MSLEKPVGDEDESEFGHFLTDDSAPAPHDEAHTALRKEALGKVLLLLSPRERGVLELRYGLDGKPPRTLDEVGRTYGVTRETDPADRESEPEAAPRADESQALSDEPLRKQPVRDDGLRRASGHPRRSLSA